jgi:hypothetical protein
MTRLQGGPPYGAVLTIFLRLEPGQDVRRILPRSDDVIGGYGAPSAPRRAPGKQASLPEAVFARTAVSLKERLIKN